ncbi:MAG: hypothetical protein ACE5HO_14935 [bacterium]
MRLRHLNDAEIQEYLDGHMDQQNSPAVHHLNSCSLCKEGVEQYQKLYLALNREVPFSLKEEFAHAVLARIQQESPDVTKSRIGTVILFALGLATAVLTSLYFIDFKLILGAFSMLVTDQGRLSSGLFSAIKEYLSTLDLDFTLFAFAVLTMLIMSAIDRFMTTLKHKGGPFLK